MVLLEHNFRSHIPRCSTVFVIIVRVPFSSNSIIGQPQVPMSIKHQILWLNISMYNPLIMSRLQRLHQTSNKKLRLILRKLPNLRMMVPQISAFHQVHYQVKKLIIMESPLNIDNEIRFNFLH